MDLLKVLLPQENWAAQYALSNWKYQVGIPSQLYKQYKDHQTTIIIGDVGNTKSDTLCLWCPYAQLAHFGGSDCPFSTVVSRFSGLGPSPSKSPLNRDSPLNGIIPSLFTKKHKLQYLLFLRFFHVPSRTNLYSNCQWAACWFYFYFKAGSVNLFGPIKTKSKKNICW